MNEEGEMTCYCSWCGKKINGLVRVVKDAKNISHYFHEPCRLQIIECLGKPKIVEDNTI
jgi:hypothetical protein